MFRTGYAERRPGVSASIKRCFAAGTLSVSFLAFALGLGVCLGVGCPAFAGVGVWTTHGPNGGWVAALAADPTAPSTLYAAYLGSGTEGGAGIYKSTDGGATWSPTALGYDQIYSVCLACDRNGVVYAGICAMNGTNAVYKSSDAAATWKVCFSHPPSGGSYSEICALAIDPVTPTTLYVGLNSQSDAPDSGVYKSTDGGATWGPSNTGLTDNDVLCLAIDPTTPATLYAATFLDKVFRSTDGGATWVACASSPFGTPNALVIDPAAPATLYDATWTGLYKSTNAGQTWNWIIPNGVPVSSWAWFVAVDPTTPSTIYADWHHYGLFKSTDGGATWAAARTGLNDEAVTLVVNPAAPATLCAGSWMSGAFRSADGGATWTQGNQGFTSDFVDAIELAAPGQLYAGQTNHRGVSMSADNGGAWTPMNLNQLNGDIWYLGVDPSTPQTLYCDDASGMIYKTTDGGINWSWVTGPGTGTYGGPFAIDPKTSSTVYFGFIVPYQYYGIAKSTNGMATWTETSLSGIVVAALAMDPQGATLYAGGQSASVPAAALSKTTNGGATWTACSIPSPYQCQAVTALAIHPTMPATVYAGTWGKGVLKSTNGGGTWAFTNAGLSSYSLYVAALAVNPLSPATLYAGTYGGVFKSWDGGQTWQAMNAGLKGLDVTALAFDQTTNTLHAGTPIGVWSFTDNTTPPQPSFDLHFLDDQGRSELCASSTLGSWKWSVLKGSGAGQILTGTGKVLKGTGFVMIQQTGSVGMMLVDYTTAHMALGTLSGAVSSGLYDRDTTNDGPCPN